MSFNFSTTLIVSLLAVSAAFSTPIKVVSGGKDSSISDEQLKALKVHEVKIEDGLESKGAKKVAVEYSGYDAKEVLDLAFGGRANWSKATDLLFVCADGYKAKVSVANFLKYPGYLVFARKGDPTFSLVNNTQGGKKVKLAPYYLVWNEATLQNVQSSGNWPYQVVAIQIAEATKK